MSAESDALNAATAQVLALVEEDQRSNVRFLHCSDVGAVNAIVVEPTPALDGYGPDVLLAVDVLTANTDDDVTLAASGLPPIAVVWGDGAPLQPGDVKALMLFKIAPGGAPGAFVAEILGRSIRPAEPAGGGGGGGTTWYEGAATTGTSAAIATILTPAPPEALAAGMKMRVKISATSAAAPMMDFGYGLKPMVDNVSGEALIGGEMPGGVGFEADLEWDGAALRLLNPFRPRGAINGARSRLRIANAPANPNVVLAISADELVLSDALGRTAHLRNLAITINNTIVGAGGVDTGVLTNSRSYDLYACYNPGTGDAKAFCTLEGNAPTLPAGYTLYRRIGWQRVDAAGRWFRINQVDDEWRYIPTPGTNTAAIPLLVSGALGDWATPTYVVGSTLGLAPSRSIRTDFAIIALDYSYNGAILSPSPNYGNSSNSINPAYGSQGGHGGVSNVAMIMEIPSTYYYAQQSNSVLFLAGGKLEL